MSTSYVLRQSPAQRYTGLAIVVGLHVLVAGLLASGLGKAVIQVVSAPIETKVIEEVVQRDDTIPPPPPLELQAAPPDFMPPPEIVIAPQPAQATNAIRQVQSKVVTKPSPPAPKPVTPPRSDPRRPNALPPYPPASRRMGEEGVVILQMYVKENGRVADARVQTSSGFSRLDQAAVREAIRNWRFIPASDEGKPVAAWMSLAVRFELTR